MTRNWWNVSRPRPANLCCDDFWQAMQTRTDNEGYGALVTYYDFNGTFRMGSDLPALRLCPWCGGVPTGPTEDAP